MFCWRPIVAFTVNCWGKRDPGLRIAGSATSSKEFLEIAKRTNPSVVIISAHLDDDPNGGMATLKEFHDTHPPTPAIIVIDSPKSAIVLDAFRAGARGIFSEHESLETLRECVRVVVEGQVWATSREVRIALEALSSVRTVPAAVSWRIEPFHSSGTAGCFPACGRAYESRDRGSPWPQPSYHQETIF